MRSTKLQKISPVIITLILLIATVVIAFGGTIRDFFRNDDSQYPAGSVAQNCRMIENFLMPNLYDGSRITVNLI